MKVLKEIHRGDQTIGIVDSEYADRIVRTYGTKNDIPGMFLCREGDMWVAIDNTAGCAWTEEFHTKLWAVRWLTSSVDSDHAHAMDERLNRKKGE